MKAEQKDLTTAAARVGRRETLKAEHWVERLARLLADRWGLRWVDSTVERRASHWAEHWATLSAVQKVA